MTIKSVDKPNKVPYVPWDSHGNDIPHMPEKRTCMKIYKNGYVKIFNLALDDKKRYYVDITRDFKRCRVCEAKPPNGRQLFKIRATSQRISLNRLKGKVEKTTTYILDPKTLEGELVAE